MRALVDLLLPPRCPGCAAPVAATGWCRPCRGRVRELRLPGGGRAFLGPGIQAVGAFAYAGVVAAALRAVKARGQHDAAAGLADLLHAALPLPAGVAITWVPASRRKLRGRALDLAELLAGPTAVPLLRRVAERPDQTALDAEQRRRSPAGAFAARGPVPRAVVLVDDVRTTGATARAAATALQQAGARRVLVATLAVGGDSARSAAARRSR